MRRRKNWIIRPESFVHWTTICPCSKHIFLSQQGCCIMGENIDWVGVTGQVLIPQFSCCSCLFCRRADSLSMGEEVPYSGLCFECIKFCQGVPNKAKCKGQVPNDLFDAIMQGQLYTNVTIWRLVIVYILLTDLIPARTIPSWPLVHTDPAYHRYLYSRSSMQCNNATFKKKHWKIYECCPMSDPCNHHH